MSTVVWSENALDDLDSAIAYIAADNPIAARKVLERIDAATDAIGQVATGRRGRVAGTYEKSVRGLPYIIAYAIQPLPGGRERIVILRVIHGARNWLPDEWPK
ncbi:MAG: type II toxin-antitoxin system RelE/ParE family toxin [Xanthobacteraceae bacterium]